MNAENLLTLAVLHIPMRINRELEINVVPLFKLLASCQHGVGRDKEKYRERKSDRRMESIEKAMKATTRQLAWGLLKYSNFKQ